MLGIKKIIQPKGEKKGDSKMKIFQRVKKCLRWLVPYGLIMIHRQKKEGTLEKMITEMREKKTRIKKYFLSLNYNEQECEIAEIIGFFQKYNFSIYPYEFTRKYLQTDIDVFYDESNKSRYVICENKRLYFPDGWSIEQIQICYNGLRIEQDKDSPHLYETEEFMIEEGDIIADVGAAEGIWALHNIEKASKVYLFECNPKWVNALQKTFEPWKKKVVIVNKYVSDISQGMNIALDDFFKNERINFIKADIEGYELKLLNGSNEIFQKNDRLKLLLCTYHRENDAAELKEILEQNRFVTEYSKGYMLFIYDDNLKEPYIRRGLIRAKNYDF